VPVLLVTSVPGEVVPVSETDGDDVELDPAPGTALAVLLLDEL